MPSRLAQVSADNAVDLPRTCDSRMASTSAVAATNSGDTCFAACFRGNTVGPFLLAKRWVFRRRSGGSRSNSLRSTVLAGGVCADRRRGDRSRTNSSARRSTVTPRSSTSHFLEVVLGARTYETIKAVLETHPIEGIVFHNADGRMAKIKARDLGVGRRAPREVDDEAVPS